MIKLFRKLWKKNNPVISETVIYEKIGNNEVSSSKISISEQKIKELNIDCVRISSYQNWNNTELTEKKLFQFSTFDVKSPFNKYEVEISFNNYGSWTVEVDYIKRNEILDKDYYFFPITAYEYNITFGLSTVSAILFITDLWNISSRYRPTICAIDRNLLNYNVLPENIYPFALASKEELFDYFSTPHFSQRFIVVSSLDLTKFKASFTYF